MENLSARNRNSRSQTRRAETLLLEAIDEITPSLSRLFDTIGKATHDGVGITRDAYGEKETEAGEILIDYAKTCGLDAEFDQVGNLNVAPAGQMQDDPEILIASHIDSVPRGGNYDGLAGVIAGIGTIAALQQRQLLPKSKLRAIGFRGEESPWFGTAYLGSKLFTGQITRAEAEKLKRIDTGKTLAQHIAALGLDIGNVGRSCIPLRKLNAYFEMHIEQAPLLEAMGCPVAVATAIRGNIRYPFAKCFGQYAHSGAVPRHLRSDALIASAKLITFADDCWCALVEAGNDDLVFTCGIFNTNPREAAMTKVPGEVAFTLNIGGTKDLVMEKMHNSIMAEAAELAQKYGVRFEFGQRVGTLAVMLDPSTIEIIKANAREMEIPLHHMPTVGHDAAMFARVNVPASVILIRNTNGSHNPDEHMEMNDFTLGLKLLALTVMKMG